MFYSLPCVETTGESKMMDEQEPMRRECSVSCHRPKLPVSATQPERALDGVLCQTPWHERQCPRKPPWGAWALEKNRQEV